MDFETMWNQSFDQLCRDVAAREERAIMYGNQSEAVGPMTTRGIQGGVPSPSSPEGPCEVRQQLEALNYNIDQLGKNISMLEERLSWILLPDSPAVAPTRGDKVGPLTGLANDIRQLGDSVVNCANRLQAMRHRVAL